ncbi:MAG: portal protein [Nitriliruptorales bacterium]
MAVKPYSLKVAQAFVKDAVVRAEPRHNLWRAIEELYRHGRTQGGAVTPSQAGRIVEHLPGLTLDSINLVLAHTTIILASVAANDPQLLVMPIGGGEPAEDTALISQSVLSYFWRRTDATDDLRDMAADTVKIGNGFGKVGWSHEEHDEDRDEDEITDELARLIEGDRRLAELGGREPLPVEELEAQVPLTAGLVDRDEPYLEYVSPYDLFVPLDARRINEARWIAQRITLPVDEVREHPDFKNKSTVTPDAINAGQHTAERIQAERGKDGSNLSREAIEAFDVATIWEFYDMRSRRLMVFQIDAEKPLLDEDLPYNHHYSPFVHMRNYDDGGKEFWSFGDLENIASVQELFNEFVFEQVTSARRAGNKYLIDQQYLTSAMKAALESDEPDQIIPVDNPNDLPLRDIVQVVARAALPAEQYQVRTDLQQWMRDVTGINEFEAGGGLDRSHISATAVAVADGVSTLRAQHKVAQVEKAARHAGLLMLMLCQEFLDEERAIRVSGSNGATWPKVSAADIQGEFKVYVEGGSTQAVNPATRRQKAVETLQAVFPVVAQMGYDPEPLLRSILRDLGMDPDQVLVRPTRPPADGAGAGGAPPDPSAGLGAPSLAPTVSQEDLGGPPVPAAVEGDIAL